MAPMTPLLSLNIEVSERRRRAFLHLHRRTLVHLHYLRDIRQSEDLQRAVLHKHAELLEARRAASAFVAVGGARAGEESEERG